MTTPLLPRAALATVALTLFIASHAEASLTLITDDRASFESLGKTASFGFEGLPGGHWYQPGAPWTTNGVVYTSDGVTVVKTSYGYGNDSDVLIVANYNLDTGNINPLTGNIIDASNMFAVDLSLWDYTEYVTFQLQTTVLSYPYKFVVPVVTADPGSRFFGFIANDGEYFTSFTITSSNQFAPVAIDNVTLGNINIPEPSTLLLLGGALGAIGVTRKKTPART